MAYAASWFTAGDNFHVSAFEKHPDPQKIELQPHACCERKDGFADRNARLP